MSNDLASTIQCKIITPINSSHHIRIDETSHIQNQRAHYAVGDTGVLTTDQVDQLGGNINITYYTLFNKKYIPTNIKNKKKAVEDIVKKLFKLQNKDSMKFILYNKDTNNKSNKLESYMAYRNKQSKKYKYRVQFIKSFE